MLLALYCSSVERPENVIFLLPLELLWLPGQEPPCTLSLHYRGDRLRDGSTHATHFSLPHTKKAWFNHACSSAVNDREKARKRFQRLPAPENHALCISAQNRVKSILATYQKIS